MTTVRYCVTNTILMLLQESKSYIHHLKNCASPPHFGDGRHGTDGKDGGDGSHGKKDGTDGGDDINIA